MPRSPDPSRAWSRSQIAACIVLWLIGPVLLFMCLARLPPKSITALDFVQFWSAARLLSEHQNPYDVTLQIERNREADVTWDRLKHGFGTFEFMPYYYPPWVGMLVLPLLPLGYATAKLVWITCLVSAVVAAAMPLAGRVPSLLSYPAMLVVLVSFALWIPAVSFGQVAPLVVLVLVATLVGFERKWDVAAGLAFVWLSIKPQLTALVILVLIAAGLKQRRWWFFAAAAVESLILIAASTWCYPDWLGAMLRAPRETPLVTENWPWYGCTAWCAVRSLLIHVDWPIATQSFVAFAICLAFALPPLAWLAIHTLRGDRDVFDLVAAALVLAFFVAPYARFYDLPVLLIPLVWLLRQPFHEVTRLLLLLAVVIIPYVHGIGFSNLTTFGAHQVWWAWLPLLFYVAWLAAPREEKSIVAT